MDDESRSRRIFITTEVRECRHCNGTSICQHSILFTNEEYPVDTYRYRYSSFRECSCCGRGLTIEGTFDQGHCYLDPPPPHCGVCGGKGYVSFAPRFY